MTNWEKLLSGLDAEYQLPAVLDPRNTIVSAGAGSGKTRVLAIRYLYLVREKNITPDRILCLTFTNKAATEMHERIYSMMRQCAEDDESFRKAIAAFGSAPVSTLDSFSASIARNGCLRWGIPPDFLVDERAAKESMEKLALEYLLEKRGVGLVSSYIAANGFEAAIDGLVSVTTSRDGLFGHDAGD